MKFAWRMLLVLLVVSIGILEGGMVMALELTSPEFVNKGYIPQKYTGQGPDVSPSLKWTGVSKGTKAFALICDDPDAPMGEWVHWVIYNVPGNSTSLKEAIPPNGVLDNGAKQGKNDFGRIGYNGPLPPPGKPHRYFFTLYCLDDVLAAPPGLTKKALLKVLEGHILEQSQIMGLYKRQ